MYVSVAVPMDCPAKGSGGVGKIFDPVFYSEDRLECLERALGRPQDEEVVNHYGSQGGISVRVLYVQ